MAVPVEIHLSRLTPMLKKFGIGVVVGGPWTLMLALLIERGVLGQAAVNQVIAWGPGVAILIGGYVLVERWAPKIIAGQAATAAANQQLADSVKQIADRGDRDMAEIRLMQKFCNMTLTTLASSIEEIRQEVKRK
jgi:hypothetical protein